MNQIKQTVRMVSFLAVMVAFGSSAVWAETEAASTESLGTSRVQLTNVKPASKGFLNPRLNPLMMTNGNWNLDLDLKILGGLTIGPSFTYYKGHEDFTALAASNVLLSRSTDMRSPGLGARVNYYFSGRAFSESSWYVSGYYKYLVGDLVQVGYDGNPTDYRFKSHMGGLLFGKQFLFQSGLNLNFGVGVLYSSLPKDIGGISTPSISRGFLPTFDVSVGWVL